MFWKLFTRKIKDYIGLFTGHFVEVKAFYALQFDKVPCVSFIGEVDSTEAYGFILKTYRNEIIDIYQHNFFDHNEKEILFNNSIFILTNNRMIEVGANYCQVLHTTAQYNWAKVLLKRLAQFRSEAAEQNKIIGFAKPQPVH